MLIDLTRASSGDDDEDHGPTPGGQIKWSIGAAAMSKNGQESRADDLPAADAAAGSHHWTLCGDVCPYSADENHAAVIHQQ